MGSVFERVSALLGEITLVLLLLFLLLAVVYMLVRLVCRTPDPSISAERMPALRPIPIPTRTRFFPMRILVWLYEVRRWEVAETWRYELDDRTTVVVHEGFIFDGASIPRPLWAILNPTGLLLIPGLLHDYGYRYGQLWRVDEAGRVVPFAKGRGKIYWDWLFWQVGRKVNGFAIIDFLAWIAVFFGGWFAWWGSRRRKETPVEPVMVSRRSAPTRG